MFTRTYAKRTVLLLFMQTLDSTLRMKRGRFTSIKTEREGGLAPNAFIPEALALSQKLGEKIEGIPSGNITDLLLGTPTTAHILGGSVMGESTDKGVINQHCEVFGYKNMLVCDGSMISANPGVNPSLSITAISEYAMSQIGVKEASEG
jgi:cholesterol oxidase